MPKGSKNAGKNVAFAVYASVTGGGLRKVVAKKVVAKIAVKKVVKKVAPKKAAAESAPKQVTKEAKSKK